MKFPDVDGEIENSLDCRADAGQTLVDAMHHAFWADLEDDHLSVERPKFASIMIQYPLRGLIEDLDKESSS